MSVSVGASFSSVRKTKPRSSAVDVWCSKKSPVGFKSRRKERKRRTREGSERERIGIQAGSRCIVDDFRFKSFVQPGEYFSVNTPSLRDPPRGIYGRDKAAGGGGRRIESSLSLCRCAG